MDPAALAGRLEAIEGRLAGSDAERRAAVLCAAQLRAAGRRPRTSTLWVRTRRGAAHALYAALGVAASIVAVSAPEAGIGLAGGALVAVLLEAFGIPVASLLQARRATQNVVAPAPAGDGVLLVLAARADAPRDALLRRVPLPAVPLLALGLAGVAACAGARLGGAEGSALGAVQLVPSVLLILLAGAFLDAALAAPKRHAAAGGPAAALAVAQALDAQPPRALRVEVLVAGGEPGLRAYVRARRREMRPEDVVLVLLGSEPGPVRYATRHRQLGELAAALPRATAAPARPGRFARWPAIALDGDARPLSAAALRLVAAIDAQVAADGQRTAAAG